MHPQKTYQPGKFHFEFPELRVGALDFLIVKHTFSSTIWKKHASIYHHSGVHKTNYKLYPFFLIPCAAFFLLPQKSFNVTSISCGLRVALPIDSSIESPRQWVCLDICLYEDQPGGNPSGASNTARCSDNKNSVKNGKPQIYGVGRLSSFWDGPFSGAMLVSGRVYDMFTYPPGN